jgi:predicted alpha/beta hydrolase family esterase
MIVIVHGYDGSGPGHFQHWLKAELLARHVDVRFPELPAPTEPERDAWVEALEALVRARGESSVTFVAHSLGCWAVDHFIARHGAGGINAALLVAPPSPYSLFEPIQDFLPPPRDAGAWAPIASRTLILGSDDDEYASDDELEDLAERIGASHRIIPGGGHLNAAAGFGPFPLVLEWLGEVGALGA